MVRIFVCKPLQSGTENYVTFIVFDQRHKDKTRKDAATKNHIK
jgi:hypothetical protein